MTDEQQRAAIAEASWNAQADHYNQWCDLGDDERADWIAGKIEGSPWSTISKTETVVPIISPEIPDGSDTPRADALERELSDSPANIETACEHLMSEYRTLERELAARDALIGDLRTALEKVRLIDHTQKRFGVIDAALRRVDGKEGV